MSQQHRVPCLIVSRQTARNIPGRSSFQVPKPPPGRNTTIATLQTSLFSERSDTHRYCRSIRPGYSLVVFRKGCVHVPEGVRAWVSPGFSRVLPGTRRRGFEGMFPLPRRVQFPRRQPDGVPLLVAKSPGYTLHCRRLPQTLIFGALD